MVWLAFATHAAAQQAVRVIAPEAAVHLRSDATSAIVLTVPAGTVLAVEHSDGDWYAVLLPPDGQGLRRFGFVAAALVEHHTGGEGVPPPRLASAPTVPPLMTERPPVEAAPAQVERVDWAREGVLVGVSVPFHRFRGTREDILVSGTDLLVVPTLQSNYGFAVTLGHSFATSAVELSYERSTHASSAAFSLRVPGLPGLLVFENESAYNRITIDYKRFLARRWRLQPYLQIGFGFPWLTVREGGLVGGAVVNATFSGVGADAGAGALFFVHPRMAIHGGAAYRYDLYLSARGGGGNWSEIQDTLTAHGLNVVTGVSFLF
jgi:hypothetical protein